MLSKTFAAVLLTLSIAAPASAQFQPVTCKNAFTQQQEIAEGDKVVAEVYKQMPVLPDSSPVAQYIQQLGARLVAVAPLTPGLTQQWPFRFHVVASEEINAFALPGGTMFVNLGAIQAAETEAQLAGVMGHEMSHVILRHSTCNLTKQQKKSVWYGLAQLGSQIALGGTGGALAASGIGMGAQLDFLHMSRDDEKQADLLGVEIAHDAGFDPRGLPQFFEIIQAKYGKGSAQFLSDHPNPGNRTEYVNQEIALLPPLQNPIKSSPQFEAIRNEALGLHAFTADELKSGTWKGSPLYARAPGAAPTPAAPPISAQATPTAAPEVAYAPGPQREPLPQAAPQPPPAAAPGTPQRLTDSQLGLDARTKTVQLTTGSTRVPSNWQEIALPDGSFAIAPPGGAGSFGIAYGVLFADAPQKSPIPDNGLGAASENLVRQLAKAHNLKAGPAVTNLQIADQPALARDLHGLSPITDAGSQIAERDWLVTFRRPTGSLGYVLFIAPEQDFDRLQPVWDTMIQSFKPQ